MSSRVPHDAPQPHADAIGDGSGARFHDLLEAVPDAILITDHDGRITFVNQQTEALFGYAREEILGQPVEILVPERFRTVHPAERGEYRAHPRTRPMGLGLTLSGLRKDGREVPVEISLSPLWIAGALFVVSSIRDVSERRRAEEERAALLVKEHDARQQTEAANLRLRSLASVTEAALANLDTDDLLRELLVRVKTILGVDTAAILLLEGEGDTLRARAALGIEEEVTLGVRVPLGKGFAGRVASERKPLVIDEVDGADIVNPLLREKGLHSLLGAPLIVEGQVLGVIHVGSLSRRDFSAEDVQLLQLVADRVALAIDRARLYEAAQEAIRLRNEFLSAISHDLGNPVASIRLLAHVLQDRLRQQDAAYPGLLDDLALIENSATAAWGLIKELLDLARLQVGRPLDLDWQVVDLVEMVREQIEVAQKATGALRILFEPATPQLVGEWDKARIERVVGNLLDNAIKYSPEGGVIRVRLAREEDEQGRRWAGITVTDTGIGIPAVDLAHIFDRFRRASNVVGRFPGTGIGLAGARQITEQHGGAICVESEEGRGTTVSVRLPLFE